LQSKHMP